MIPKVIHYCWFGGNPLPDLALRCIESWKRYNPDYEIIRWDEDNYDINADYYTAEAYRAKKWAFLSDYARLKIVYENGGIYLDTDVEALFQGDPAAESKDAIIMSYPGLYAISVQRFAHVLYQLRVPIIPRILTEHAHSKTGIDINPGASIGKYFFIDHGTGIVIGETTEIGEHVKVYQGVTLGALSTRGGRTLVSKKRHPTIEDSVTIYSGASILGGDTVIGKNAVIGGNVFLTHSVPANSKIYVKNQELNFDGDFFGPDDYVI